MTRPFNQQFHCANCGTWQTQETSFSRWIRRNSELSSGDGYAVSDQDMWIHKFKTDQRGRMLQFLMLVEIKTNGAGLSISQFDTLHAANQVMRNRRQTPTKDAVYQAGTAPTTVRSAMIGRDVQLRVYGMHVLTFEGLGPDDSSWIKWDASEITEDDLTRILRFDMDPDTLKPIDLRIHHPEPSQNTMF